MTGIPAYQTYLQSLYVGTPTALATLTDNVGVPLASEVRSDARPVLQATRPSITATDVGYAIAVADQALDAETAKLKAMSKPAAVLVQEDALRGAVFAQCAIAGTPAQARRGRIVNVNLQVAQAGEAFRCTAVAIAGGSQNIPVPAESSVWVVVTAGAGNLTRGGSTEAATEDTLHRLTGAGTTVGIPAAVTGGWVLYGESTTIR